MKVRLEVSERERRLSLLLLDDVAATLGLKHGDQIEADLLSKPVELSPSARRQHLASLRKYRGRILADFRFDRQDANAR